MKKVIYRLKLFLLFVCLLFVYPVQVANAQSMLEKLPHCYDVYQRLYQETNRDIRPEDVEGAIVFEPVYPASYQNIELDKLASKGKKIGKQPQTLLVSDYSFDYIDLKGSSGDGKDFDHLNEILDQNQVACVGGGNVESFFGHYYDLTGNGVFNALVDEDLLYEGSEMVVTDKDGYSKGYEVSQIINFNIQDQDKCFYGDDLIRQLAYNGNDEAFEMVYIQYCRWDIELGQLVSAFGYRVW